MYHDDDQDHDIMIDRVANLEGAYMDECLSWELRRHFGGSVVHSLGRPAPQTYDWEERAPGWKPVEIYWITEMTTFTSVKEEYIAYGNEASLEHCYGHVCLVVNVGPAGKRAEASK
jgi:hypothetical protein